MLGSRRRGWIVASAVALVCGGMAACSSGDGQAGGSLPTLDTSSTATASDGASPDATTGDTAAPAAGASVNPEDVTAESLSNPETEYYVTSIPEDLSPEQAEVLVAYIAYSRTTWEAYRDMNGTAEVEAVTTGETLKSYLESYNTFAAAGQHIEGQFSVSILSVEAATENSIPNVSSCTDQHRIRIIDSQGNDVTEDSQREKFKYTYYLDWGTQGWIVYDVDRLGPGQC